MDQPDQGSVLIGKDCVPVRRGMVGVVAQNYPLFEHRTVAGNLELAARSAGLSRQDAWRATFYPCQLSGGQRQRVAIAQQFLYS